MKKIFTLALLLVTVGLSAQQFNNEWIDFSKTYYKFKVGKTGLYRIPQPVLASAGLGSVPAQDFQLFRNGKEVPIYTSAAGVMGPSDYIEFWGWMNDGSPDNPLYRSSSYQHTTHWSLETDTAVFFLTVNTTTATFHYNNQINDTTGTPLTVEPWFLYKAADYFKSQINPGFAQVVGEYVYSSSYDIGEFWSSPFISPGGPFSDIQNNLDVAAGGPNPTLKFGMVGCADNTRDIQVTLNNTAVADTEMDAFGDLVSTKTIPLALINSGTATISFINNSPTTTDRAVASFYELEYPRQFNFNGQPTFYFDLPAKSDGYFLKINNFAISGGTTPILYDISNGLRYAAITGPGSTLSFLLAGSASARKLVLVNEDPSIVTTVTGFTTRNFTNYAMSANQGNYIIISSPVLATGSRSNNSLLDYKTYRNSIAGGAFNSQIYDISELIDQFAFGIKIHPLSIQNFLRYARTVFGAKPRYVLLIGHSMVYSDYNLYSEVNHDPLADRLDIIPTFGYPASDNKLAVDNGAGDVPITPIGRLSVVSGTEIDNYLDKVKEYESAQANNAPTIDQRLWMRNALHVTGVSEPYLGTILCNYMYSYQQIITDTLFGASVTTFCDGNATQVSQIPAAAISTLFHTGLSMMNYFGHSANAALGYNLDDPQDYDNQGKYPVFYINGCDAGDFFVYDPQRFTTGKTLSETYVLAKERGAIAFIASTHFGIVNYLNILLYGLYNLITGPDYGKPIGDIEKDALQTMLNQTPNDYFSRLHAEEMTTHGDPYLRLNQSPLPDYDVEASTVQVVPNFISISDNSFVIKAAYYNLGKAVNDSIRVLITRKYPDGHVTTIYNKKIKGIRYADSVQLAVPIVATTDKGQNYVTVTINPDTTVAEMTRINNTVTVAFFVYQNEATPAYPYNYAIINTPTSKLVASTANAFTPVQQYVMEIDTTQLFNSAAKVDKFLTSVGGELEFDPGISYQDSTVYYWRVSAVPGTGGQYTWNDASFIYIDPAHSSAGSAQSHYFQHLQTTGDSISMAANRKWVYGTTSHNFYLRNGMYGTSGFFDNDFSVTVDGNEYIASACLGHSLAFSVFNPVTTTAWENVDAFGNNLHLFGSADANCGTDRYWNLEFSYEDAASRKQIMDFMDSIPAGYIVAIRSFDYDPPNSYPSTWEADTAIYGHNRSLYHYLQNAGFTAIDSLNSQPRDWVMLYKKQDPTFPAQAKYSDGLYDKITLSVDVPTPYFTGSILSPRFGPAKSWKQVHWRGTHANSPATDTASLQVIGIDTLGNSNVLYSLDQSTQDFDISAVNAAQYPYVQLRMYTTDSVHANPYQLQYWRVNYVPVPEGALAPNILLKSKDTLALGEPMEFAIPFKNISPYAFDSMRIKVYVIDRSNVTHVIPMTRRKPLISGDTVMLDFTLDTKSYPGSNTLYVDFNPDNDQPEEYVFNNFLYKNFYVRFDQRSPLLDVTFDNVHILNDDIVSAKPHIQIKLKSQSEYLLLTDTASVSVQLRYPDGSIHPFGFNTDTLRFTPASSSADNEATVDFTPVFTKQYNADGDEYQLIVTGKDASGNTAGSIPYRIAFKVITKAMISNMLNYPNPFTTSTAFVFTITGSDVPQNIKIQILTITGKIVREITKDELGPLHVGRNITEFKWNGTDMYGARLANGVYLYHVVTNLNGKSLDKYKSAADNTDQYFNNGYGKMYLMK